MELKLLARLDKIQAQASKDDGELDPTTVLTLKSSTSADTIGRLARFIGQDVDITISTVQLSFDDLKPPVVIGDRRGNA